MSMPSQKKDGGAELTAPEQLTEYIRVSNPSVWIALGAIALLLFTFLTWCLSANLETTVAIRGIERGGDALCYVDKPTAKRLTKGMRVVFDNGARGEIAYVSGTALTREQAKRQIGEDNIFTALLGDENCLVVVGAQDLPDGIYDMTVVIEQVSPLSFLMN